MFIDLCSFQRNLFSFASTRPISIWTFLKNNLYIILYLFVLSLTCRKTYFTHKFLLRNFLHLWRTSTREWKRHKKLRRNLSLCILQHGYREDFKVKKKETGLFWIQFMPYVTTQISVQNFSIALSCRLIRHERILHNLGKAFSRIILVQESA